MGEQIPRLLVLFAALCCVLRLVGGQPPRNQERLYELLRSNVTAARAELLQQRLPRAELSGRVLKVIQMNITARSFVHRIHVERSPGDAVELFSDSKHELESLNSGDDV